MSPLVTAASQNDAAAVRRLLAAGADPNDTANLSMTGLTPLIWAAGRNNLEAARALLEGGADVSARSSYGTALEGAREKKFVQMVALLEEYERRKSGTPPPTASPVPAEPSIEPRVPAAVAPGGAKGEKLAVLELRNFAREITRENAQYFTDVVRQAALKWAPAVDVMTRENLLVLLQASGKRLEECEGECEVDTGRRIGADRIISGEIQKVGTRYKVSLRLHETRGGKLVSSAIATGNTIDQLDDSVAAGAEQLFKPR